MTSSPASSAVLAPMTANVLSPTASSTLMGVSNRSSHWLSANAANPPPPAVARYGHSRNAVGGTAPISTSRMIPPPRAVITPRVTTPTMSSRAARTAVSAPLSANANVPVKSSANNNGGAVAIPGILRPSAHRPAAGSRRP